MPSQTVPVRLVDIAVLDVLAFVIILGGVVGCLDDLYHWSNWWSKDFFLAQGLTMCYSPPVGTTGQT